MGAGALRAGIVGLGRAGGRHAENRARVPGVKLVAACSSGEEERFADAFLREPAHLVECVRNDAPPALTLREATEATRIALTPRTSLLERRVVEL